MYWLSETEVSSCLVVEYNLMLPLWSSDKDWQRRQSEFPPIFVLVNLFILMNMDLTNYNNRYKTMIKMKPTLFQVI